MNIPELLCQETFVASSNIKETEASFSPRHTNIFPGDQGRVTLSDVTCPQEISANANDWPNNTLWHREDV
jgi:hypothetical protein